MRQSEHSLFRFSFSRKLLLAVVLIPCISLGIVTSRYVAARITDKQPQQSTPLCKDCNIVLISLDVCSAKHIPCYGYGRNTMPNLCAFAEKNQLFLNSFANATYTLPSRVSMFTGLFPFHHSVNIAWRDKLDGSVPLLTEVLQKNGYETVLLQEKNSSVLPLDTVYNRGNTEVNDAYTQSDIVPKIEQYAKNGKKTFISYYNADCHEPNRVGKNTIFTKDIYPQFTFEPTHGPMEFTPGFYQYLKEKVPPALKENAFEGKTAYVKDIFDRMVASGSYEGAKAIFEREQSLPNFTVLDNMQWSYLYETFIDVSDKRQMEYFKALYDQQLVNTDNTVIDEFIQSLNSSKFKDNTIVLITAEHGQEFGEHGVFGHTTLYDGNIRVPFILSVPGIKPRKYLNPVQGVDIMPTLLDLVGIQHEYAFDGVSLAPLLRQDMIPDRLIITMHGDKYRLSIRKGKWKLHVTIGNNEIIPFELFDMLEDPEEQTNILFKNMTVATQIIEEYNLVYGFSN